MDQFQPVAMDVSGLQVLALFKVLFPTLDSFEFTDLDINQYDFSLLTGNKARQVICQFIFNSGVRHGIDLQVAHVAQQQGLQDDGRIDGMMAGAMEQVAEDKENEENAPIDAKGKKKQAPKVPRRKRTDWGVEKVDLFEWELALIRPDYPLIPSGFFINKVEGIYARGVPVTNKEMDLLIQMRFAAGDMIPKARAISDDEWAAVSPEASRKFEGRLQASRDRARKRLEKERKKMEKNELWETEVEIGSVGYQNDNEMITFEEDDDKFSDAASTVVGDEPGWVKRIHLGLADGINRPC